VLRDDRPFNWSALNNAAVHGCDAPWLLFLNDDVALAAVDTLARLARYLTLDPAIGAVGAFLTHDPHGLQPQHDGIATDPRWIARNVVSESDGSGFGVPRNVSAVTGACMLTRRAAFEACGGFDEQFAVSFNDVDYCLQLRKLGWRIVQASDVHAVHREYATRGVLDTSAKRRQLESEMAAMRAKWGDALVERYRLNYDREVAATRIVRLEAA
jgi:GT2 family glycosyltransferase